MNTRIKVSATQISNFLSCKRLWAAASVLSIRKPQTEAQAFGLRGHKMLELYHKTGKPIDDKEPWQFSPTSPVRFPGKSAKKAIPYIPAPKTGFSERGFSFKIKDVEFIGYIDLEWTDENGLWLLDYKFTSSFGEHTLTDETLSENVQATIYGAKAFIQNKELQQVNLRWLYLLSTKNPRARPVNTTITRDENRGRLKDLMVISYEMAEIKESLLKQKAQGATDIELINSLEPTIKSCGKYNGCDHTDKCKLTAEQLTAYALDDGDEDDMPLDPKLAAMLAKKGIDVDKYKKTSEPEPKEEKVEETKEAKPKSKPTQTKLDLSKYTKTPTTPEPNEKRGEIEVKLNAPENYLDNEQEMQKPLQDGQTRLSVEEKETLKTLITKLIDSL